MRLLQGEGLAEPEAQLLGEGEGVRVSVALPDTVCVPLAHNVGELVCVVEVDCVWERVPEEHKEGVTVAQEETDTVVDCDSVLVTDLVMLAVTQAVGVIEAERLRV